MVLTVEFFLGLIAAFFIGYSVATALEQIFHISLDLSKMHTLQPNKSKKHE
jgi:hypothetical protein